MKELKQGVYLHEKEGNYRVVYPIKKDLDKPLTKDNIHWKNLLLGGSWKHFMGTMVMMAVIFLVIWSYAEDTKTCRGIIEKPCEYCALRYPGTITLSNATSPYADMLNGGNEVYDLNLHIS